MSRNEIILRISQIRCRASLSARELSRRIEMNDGYINRLESKKDFLPSVEVLLRIIEQCGSTPSEFFYYDLNAYTQDFEFIKLCKRLDSGTKKIITELISKIISPVRQP